MMKSDEEHASGETDPLLLSSSTSNKSYVKELAEDDADPDNFDGGLTSQDIELDEDANDDYDVCNKAACRLFVIAATLAIVLAAAMGLSEKRMMEESAFSSNNNPTSSYTLLEKHQGDDLKKYYKVVAGPSTKVQPDNQVASTITNLVSKNEAISDGLLSIKDDVLYMTAGEREKEDPTSSLNAVYLESLQTFREGLFVIDVHRIPSGCGVGHSISLLNPQQWPQHGEIRISSGSSIQNHRMSLLTNQECNMYGQVSAENRTGVWERATGVVDPITGEMDSLTNVPSDNCNIDAPHQLPHQGCVTVDDGNGNSTAKTGNGTVFVLEWDPVNGYIQQWIFERGSETMPEKLRAALDQEQSDGNGDADTPLSISTLNPHTWNATPFAYYPLGRNNPHCSSKNFQHPLRLTFSMDFCNSHVGNAFAEECPELVPSLMQQQDDQQIGNATLSMLACTMHIQSTPIDVLQRSAYWAMRGVYVYERSAR